jgi:hypothetical protein
MNDAKRPSRCAAWAREVGLDPGGTAPRADVFVIVEHPLPWPSDLGDDPLLSALERIAREHAGSGRSVRLQAVAVDPEALTRRVIVFHGGSPPFSGYGRLEGAGIPEQLPEIVAGLVGAEPQPPVTGRVTDLLICAHGSRDTCCGSLGTRLWLDLDGSLDVRVWRTSHTGGHRFAPTAITFPDGNYWAHLDADRLRGVVDRTLPAETAAGHLRGCASFTPNVQVADRAVLARLGWGWLDCARFGEQRSPRRVQLCFEAPDGERGGFDVWVDEARQMPVPDCGGDPATATKVQSEFRVARLKAWT